MRQGPVILLLVLLVWPALPVARAADGPEVDFEHFGELESAAEFDDRPLEEPLSLPDWFKLSFLDLGEDLNEALQAGNAASSSISGKNTAPTARRC